VAYVPGAAFFAEAPDARTLRLSFVTASVEQIDRGIAALANVVRFARVQSPDAPAAAALDASG
ncbi:MAG: PLP-dependent aminotransferase family protein, partial [Tibeticola sp.]|nr:PLP-dependent aminotransferase family protein [Tibeticola sp.]